ncbi:hypothetical protein PVAG01_01941 [Phlyctema vagabunda]|uniref:Epidermal growth factor receptor-like transmembrane-juxtamembrane segment domain-containing protein n=1 Tax=Phlyctema vagabunda TaxID=108571 RepID=A0ABR4PYJ0_9HELO
MSRTSTARCFAKTLNNVSDSEWEACGHGNSTTPFVPCCARGDQCLAHGLCHYSYSKVGGSGYYVSGCTDSAYAGRNCPDLCTSQAFPDITWNNTARLWQCCGVNPSTNVLNCNAPTNEQFDAPGPNFIRTYWPPTRHKAKANIGAIVGGVVGGVVVLLLLAVSALVLWRRRRLKQAATSHLLTDSSSDTRSPVHGDSLSMGTMVSDSSPKTRLASPAQPAELHDGVALTEMETQVKNADHEAQNTAQAAELPGSSPERHEVVVLPYGVLGRRR